MNNPPAFPLTKAFQTIEADGGVITSNLKESEGMTLRDYFAAKAMQAMLGNSAMNDQWPSIGLMNERFAKEAYVVADSMLAEREEGMK